MTKPNSTLLALTLAASLAAAGAARAQTATYDLVAQDVGGVMVTGTLLTDGAIGVLSASDILGFDVTLSLGGQTETLQNLQDLIVQGAYLTETSSQISWNFAGGTGAQFTIQPQGPGITQFNVYTNRFDVDFNGQEYAADQSGDIVARHHPGTGEPCRPGAGPHGTHHCPPPPRLSVPIAGRARPGP